MRASIISDIIVINYHRTSAKWISRKFSFIAPRASPARGLFADYSRIGPNEIFNVRKKKSSLIGQAFNQIHETHVWAIVR